MFWCTNAFQLNPLSPQVTNVNVAVDFLFQLIFIFLLFLGMVMYANEF